MPTKSFKCHLSQGIHSWTGISHNSRPQRPLGDFRWEICSGAASLPGPSSACAEGGLVLSPAVLGGRWGQEPAEWVRHELIDTCCAALKTFPNVFESQGSCLINQGTSRGLAPCKLQGLAGRRGNSVSLSGLLGVGGLSSVCRMLLDAVALSLLHTGG